MNIPLEPLTPAAFAPFGTVMADPARHPAASAVAPTSANQGTATKYSPIAPLLDRYQRGSSPRVSLFVCEPRAVDAAGIVAQPVLERHPYTTQAFIPLGLDPAAGRGRSAFIVVVAPPAVSSNGDRPDVRRARAFLARGDMAVTYGVGVWHAPMIVVGEHAVSFVVVQFVNGVPAEDCIECYLGGDEEIRVDISGVLEGMERRAKL